MAHAFSPNHTLGKVRYEVVRGGELGTAARDGFLWGKTSRTTNCSPQALGAPKGVKQIYLKVGTSVLVTTMVQYPCLARLG